MIGDGIGKDGYGYAGDGVAGRTGDPDDYHVHDAGACCECGGAHCCCACPVFAPSREYRHVNGGCA